MSHFYGTLQGARGRATRCGTRASGLTTVAAGWGGAIAVRVYQDEDTGEDCFVVEQIPWGGQGTQREIASGVLGVSLDRRGSVTLPHATDPPDGWDARQAGGH